MSAGVGYLAWKYLTHHWVTTVWLVSCIGLTLYLPVASRVVIRRFESELQQRAQSTPLVVGGKGSRFELAINALHFTGQPPESIEYRDFKDVRRLDLGLTIPIHSRYRTRSFPGQSDGYPIVGTNLDYLDFRQLRIAAGNRFLRLGECVIGAEIAKQEGLSVGETIMSQTDNAYDLTASQPLKMRIVGILEPRHNDDDRAVLVDVKTAWVIEGLGHGHEELSEEEHEDLLLGKEGDEYVASDAVTKYLEITPENISSFHFHGNPNDFPISSVVVQPKDVKSATMLEGKFVSDDAKLQVIRPPEVMDELMQRVFKARRFFDVALIVVVAVTSLFVALITLLSRRLRRREMATMYKIGCAPFTMASMQATELALVLVMSLALAGMLTVLTVWMAPEIIRQLVF